MFTVSEDDKKRDALSAHGAPKTPRGIPKGILIAACVSGLIGQGPLAVHSGVGLVTRFADVVLENVNVGQVYNLRSERSVPYTLKNRGSAPTKVVIEVLIPSAKELQPGYEAIPDPTWVKIIPNHLMLEANGAAFSEVVLEVPDDPRYTGRHFQAAFWAHSSDEGLIGVGVRSRFRFSTGPGPDTLKQEKQRKAMLTLDFDMLPQTIYLIDVEPGIRYDVKEEMGKSIKITNRAETALSFTLASAPWNERYSLPEGYEAAPDPAWLKVEPAEMDVEGLQIKVVKMFLEIPKANIHRGKKYAFMVKAQLQAGVEIEVLSRVYVTVSGGS
ncbi:MAG: hypothetical protein HY548_01025 [Elusimicrobia bacterium]|nr:hypothetical protein [Elusimicrobiota bacterium]